MRRTGRIIQVIGLVTAVEGTLFASIPRRFASALLTDRLGTPYLRLSSALNALPDRRIRRLGFAEVAAGVLAVALAQQLITPKKEEEEMKETISKERSIELLRELADSLEKSRELQTSIQGQMISIPPESEIEIEYETKEKGGEFELELKWKSA